MRDEGGRGGRGGGLIPMPSALSVPGGHGHLDLGVSIGPRVLWLALLTAVLVVAAFAMLRGFIGEPSRRTTVAVAGTAGGGATLELLVSGGLTVPEQVVPLLLAAAAVPIYLSLSRDARFAPAIGHARRLAPSVFWSVALLATVQFLPAWLGEPGRARTLHTGVLLGLVALAWFAVARTRGPVVTIGTRVGAALLANVLVIGVAQAAVERPPETATVAVVAHGQIVAGAPRTSGEVDCVSCAIRKACARGAGARLGKYERTGE